MSKNALTITDQRNDKTYESPIENGTVRAMDLRKIKINSDDFGLMTYDPAFMNTAACKSSITFIDGDKGILRYRGYDIDDLAPKATYEEVVSLMLHGKLPTAAELAALEAKLSSLRALPEATLALLRALPRDAWPMDVLRTAVSSL